MYVVSLLTHLKMPFSDSPLTFFLTLFIPLLWVFFKDKTKDKVKILYNKDVVEIIIFSFRVLHKYEIIPSLESIIHYTKRK